MRRLRGRGRILTVQGRGYPNPLPPSYRALPHRQENCNYHVGILRIRFVKGVGQQLASCGQIFFWPLQLQLRVIATNPTLTVADRGHTLTVADRGHTLTRPV